eukprot:8961586-Alexandrium_andersonii.AAC.1
MPRSTLLASLVLRSSRLPGTGESLSCRAIAVRPLPTTLAARPACATSTGTLGSIRPWVGS